VSVRQHLLYHSFIYLPPTHFSHTTPHLLGYSNSAIATAAHTVPQTYRTIPQRTHNVCHQLRRRHHHRRSATTHSRPAPLRRPNHPHLSRPMPQPAHQRNRRRHHDHHPRNPPPQRPRTSPTIQAQEARTTSSQDYGRSSAIPKRRTSPPPEKRRRCL